MTMEGGWVEVGGDDLNSKHMEVEKPVGDRSHQTSEFISILSFSL